MPLDAWYTPREAVLLTGAGFSKPYGGFLGSEMWSLILNQPQISRSQKLRACLLENLNYEAVYDAILTSDRYSEEEQTNFTVALKNAYLQLDDAIRTNDRSRLGLASMMCQYFVSSFIGSGRERGFVFTLNQDLLVERFYSQDRGTIQIPSLGHPKWFHGQFRTPLESENWITIPPDDQINKYKTEFWSKDSGIEQFVYLKLHGSYGWRYGDGKNALVVGLTKRLADWLDQPIHEFEDQAFPPTRYERFTKRFTNRIGNTVAYTFLIAMLGAIAYTIFETFIIHGSDIAWWGWALVALYVFIMWRSHTSW